MLKRLSEQVYPLIWRWHFLIGLCCAPVLLVLSVTGALYAFQPQLEPLLEKDWQQIERCEVCTAHPVSTLVQTVMQRYPGAELEHYGEYADSGRSRVFFLKAAGEDEHRLVWINPYTLEILGSRFEDDGFFPTVFALHTRLLSGEWGRWLIELVASWIVVTLLLGLVLWWPRRKKRGGAWAPRWQSQGRRFWRDLHAVGGFYLLPMALIIAYTGLLFSPVAGRALLFEMNALGQIPDAFLNPPRVEVPAVDAKIDIDALVADFKRDAPSADWFITWPHESGDPVVISIREALPWNTRMIYYQPYTQERLAALLWEELKPGAKALLLFFPLHTGLILAWPGQLLALLTALGMTLLSVTGIWMWSLRRDPGRLSMPRLNKQVSLGYSGIVVAVLLGLLMPLFAVSVLIVAGVSSLAGLLTSRQGAEITPEPERNQL